MIDPVTGAMLISGGASLLGGSLNYLGNVNANNTNIKLSREQMAWQEQMWRMNNKYNSPIMQMTRLKQAGLNPNLVYGGHSVGNTSSGPPSSYQRANVDNVFKGVDLPNMLNILGEYVNIKNAQKQGEAIQANIDYVKANTENKSAETALTMSKQTMQEYLNKFIPDLNLQKLQAVINANERARQEIEWRPKLYKASLENIGSQIEGRKQTIENQKYQLEKVMPAMVKRTLELLPEELRKLNIDNRTKEWLLPYEIKKIKVAIEKGTADAIYQNLVNQSSYDISAQGFNPSQRSILTDILRSFNSITKPLQNLIYYNK